MSWSFQRADPLPNTVSAYSIHKGSCHRREELGPSPTLAKGNTCEIQRLHTYSRFAGWLEVGVCDRRCIQMSRERADPIQPLFTSMIHPLGRTGACTHSTGSRPTHRDEKFSTTAIVPPGLISGSKCHLRHKSACCPVMTYCVRCQWSVQRKYLSVANRDKREYHNMRKSSNKYAPQFLAQKLLSISSEACSTDEILGSLTQA